MINQSSIAFKNRLVVSLALLAAILLVLTFQQLQNNSSGGSSSGGGSGADAQALETCLATVASLNSTIDSLDTTVITLQTDQEVLNLQLTTCDASTASLSNINTFFATGFQPCMTLPADVVEGATTFVCSLPSTNTLISFAGLDTPGTDIGLVVDWSTSCTSSIYGTTIPGVLACPAPAAASKRRTQSPAPINCALPDNVTSTVCGAVALSSTNLIYYDPITGLYICAKLQPAVSTEQDPIPTGCLCFISGGAIATCPDVGALTS